MEYCDIIGYIYKIQEEKQITTTLTKRSFILETNLYYDKHDYVLFDVFNDNCKLLDTIKIGDKCKVKFEIRGRLFSQSNGFEKCFNTLKAVDIKLES